MTIRRPLLTGTFLGFVGVALAWQVPFLMLSMDPVRYRLMMIPAFLEKAAYGTAVIILFLQHRVPAFVFASAFPDLLFGVLFLVAIRRTEAQPNP